MRFITGILVFLSSLTLEAQKDYNQVNFGQIYYDLFGQNIAQQSLEDILNAFASFGDDEIILEEAFRSLLTTEKNEVSDSLIGYWLSDYSVSDSMRLSRLPNISGDYRTNAYSIVMMSYFAKAFDEGKSLLEARIRMHDVEKDCFPNYPREVNFANPIMERIYLYYIFNKWFLEHENEFNFFINGLSAYSREHTGGASDRQLTIYAASLRKHFQSRRSIYVRYLPIPLDSILAVRNKQSEKSLKYSELCKKESIHEFVSRAYLLVFKKEAPEEVTNDLVAYIEKNRLYDPELIYLSLLLKRYE